MSPQDKTQVALRVADESFRKRDYDSAIQFATAAIRLSPDEIGAFRIRGTARAFKGDYEGAAVDFTQIIKRSPEGYPHVYYLRGDCLLAAGFVDLAIKDYTKCLRLMPSDGKVWYYRARAYAIAGQSDNALRDIERGLATGTHHAKKLEALREAILRGAPIPAHAPCSN